MRSDRWLTGVGLGGAVLAVGIGAALPGALSLRLILAAAGLCGYLLLNQAGHRLIRPVTAAGCLVMISWALAGDPTRLPAYRLLAFVLVVALAGSADFRRMRQWPVVTSCTAFAAILGVWAQPQFPVSWTHWLMDLVWFGFIPALVGGLYGAHRRTAEVLQHYRRLAVTDSLTGLCNARRIHDLLERELLRAEWSGQPLAVAVVDLDRFKFFNDTFGHSAGDEVLRRVGTVLRACSRPGDHAGRSGGDEFLLVLPNTRVSHARAVGEEILRRLDQERWVPARGRVERLSASVGIAVYPEHAQTCRRLVDAADTAMYVAKQGLGGGRVQVAAAQTPETVAGD